MRRDTMRRCVLTFRLLITPHIVHLRSLVPSCSHANTAFPEPRANPSPTGRLQPGRAPGRRGAQTCATSQLPAEHHAAARSGVPAASAKHTGYLESLGATRIVDRAQPLSTALADEQFSTRFRGERRSALLARGGTLVLVRGSAVRSAQSP